MPFSSSNAPYPANEPLPSGNAFSVLVVEDQGSVRAALVAELRRAGVSDIFEAPAGQAALHLFKTHRPDLVLLDLTMPGTKGFSALLRIRGKHPDVPVIVISSNDQPRVIQRARQFDAAAFIPKASPPALIHDAIAQVLEGGSWFPPITVASVSYTHLRAQRPY